MKGPRNVVRSVNGRIPSGYVLARLDPGTGPAQMTSAQDLAKYLLGKGFLQETIDQTIVKKAKGAKYFVKLLDVPHSYTGAAGQAVIVNETEDGLEFVDASGLSIAFINLTDVPASYTGAAGQAVIVNATEDGLEFSALASAFIDLTDVPSSYSGAGGDYVTVKATEDGLEFTAVAPPSSIHMPVTLGDIPPTFVCLPDGTLVYTLVSA